MNCTDIGTIQAFIDGELSFEASSQLTGHIASCDQCATLLAEAEAESALVFPVLEREFDSLVPTQRLWNKIAKGIEHERSSASWWARITAFGSIFAANPVLTSTAAMAILICVAGIFWLSRRNDNYQASVLPYAAAVNVDSRSTVDIPSGVTTTGPADGVERPAAALRASVKMAEPRPEQYRTPVDAKVRSRPDRSGFEDETAYLQAIDELTRTVAENGSSMMGGSERIAYERDLALVDDSITRMRRAVKQDPRNDAARQILYNSYQNKIDLLTSAAQRNEFVASIK